MALDRTALNGIFYINKNRELNYRHFDVTDDLGIEIYKSIPNEDYLIVGVFLQGQLTSLESIPQVHSLTENHFIDTKKALSPIELFLCISKRNVYFNVSDSNYRTENEPFEIIITK